MARIRTIKPSFWEDELMASLARDARLLFIATWNLADDEGILRWTPEYLKAAVFGYDADLTPNKVRKLMDALVDAGLVFPYQGGKARQNLALIVSFRKHQRINRPQPTAFPTPSLQNPVVRRMYGARDGWICGRCKEHILQPGFDEGRNLDWPKDDSDELSLDHIIPRLLGGTDAPSNIQSTHQRCNKSKGARIDSLNDSANGTEDVDGAFTAGMEEEWNGRGMDGKKHAVPAKFPVTPEMKSWASKKGFNWIDLERETEAFLDHHASKGNKFSDWQRAWQTWIRNVDKWATERGNKPTAQDQPFVPKGAGDMFASEEEREAAYAAHLGEVVRLPAKEV